MSVDVRSSVRAVRRWCSPVCILITGAVMIVESASASAPVDTMIVREALGITLPRRIASEVIRGTPLDPWITGGRTTPPAAGDPARCPDGTEVKWERVEADSNGWFQSRPPAERYVAVIIERESPARMILEGMGNDIVYVNGVPRSGNPYQQTDSPSPWEPHFDYSSLPIELSQGKNLILFRYTRGGLKIRLLPVTKSVLLNSKDATLPDAILGTPLDSWGSVAIVNSTAATLRGCRLVCLPAGGKADTIGVPPIPVMGVRKVSFRIGLLSPAVKESVPLHLTLLEGGTSRQTVVDTVTLLLRVVGANDPRRETFISSIDGSVQYYAVTPPPSAFAEPPALFFSLHGAGVEALNQAASYEPKKWGYVVAPTNRRPYGFSWEDWGRLDALEVLDRVKKKYSIDEGRIYLTGHSMGGHGTWFMGATYPDQFAAIGPSAGWITFQTYRFTNPPPETSQVKLMLRRAAATSDLFSLVNNYRHFGIYILHGAVDDNVPPEQSYMMIDHLKPFHKDFEFHEQPGVGHWWDISPEPGSDCVDWRPMFDFFARHVRPGIERTRTIDFTTADPGVSSRDSWLSIDAQERQLEISRVRCHLDPGLNQVQGTTVNVRRLAIRKTILRSDRAAVVELDSQRIEVRMDGIATDEIWFAKEKGAWTQAAPPSAGTKNARRCGTFKESFRNRMALVYGTSGTPEENSWAFSRARYDAEKLWYQGNASVDVLADTEFVPSRAPDRNVVLYGNSRTHRLWKALLPDCPISVDREQVVIGKKSVKRPDICCIFLRPRPGSEVASVGVVSGTRIQGLQLSNLVQYLEPGLGLPDLTAFDADVLTKGEAGIILSGFFGPDWSMDSGEFVSGKR